MSPTTELACAFPPSRGMRGAMTTLSDLAWSFAFRNRIFCPTKAEATRLIMEAGMRTTEAFGHGNRARRRLKTLSIRSIAEHSHLGRGVVGQTGTSLRAHTQDRG